MADLNKEVLQKAQHLIKTFQDGLNKGCKIYSVTLKKELTTVLEIIDALEIAKSPTEIIIFENEEEFQKFLTKDN